MFLCEFHFLDLKTFQSMFFCFLRRNLRPVFLNRRALASIIPGRENLSF
jgi:hypothetical protein